MSSYPEDNYKGTLDYDASMSFGEDYQFSDETYSPDFISYPEENVWNDQTNSEVLLNARTFQDNISNNSSHSIPTKSRCQG